jgi:hypothetical protein
MSRYRSLATIAIAALLAISPRGASAQVASASIQVTVAQPQPVAAGTNFDFTVNVSNEGPMPRTWC